LFLTAVGEITLVFLSLEINVFPFLCNNRLLLNILQAQTANPNNQGLSIFQKDKRNLYKRKQNRRYEGTFPTFLHNTCILVFTKFMNPGDLSLEACL